MSLNIRRFVGHVVASFIPNKRVSRNVKNTIQYGVLRKMRESKQLRSQENKQSKYKYNLAVVAIMKNEGPYLKEWIEFHKLVGVEKFYLYDNESTDDTANILKPYVKSGLVEYIYFPGQKMQLPAYNDCIQKFKTETKWLAVIDLDEFIVPVRCDKITDILDVQKTDVAQLIVPWVIFGSNGHQTKPDGFVLENYTKRARHSWLYKSIINPRLVFNMGCHEHNVAGRTVSVSSSKLRVHHYHCKSWQEYQLKAVRGDAWNGNIVGAQRYQRELFARHDLNDVLDTTACRFVAYLPKD